MTVAGIPYIVVATRMYNSHGGILYIVCPIAATC